MTINRNNYENFFLLYVDGELAPQQMLEVDAFCEKHPDLAEELQLLMDTRLTPDNELAFEGKAELLQPELWDADQLTPLQASLLDMLDRTPAADPNTLSNEPLVQKEWQLLQHTRLTAEAASMPQKHRLIKAMQWDADNLTSTQLQLLEALDNGGSIPAAVLADAETHKDWLLLQQTLLQPEAVLMPNKEKLLRSEAGRKSTGCSVGRLEKTGRSSCCDWHWLVCFFQQQQYYHCNRRAANAGQGEYAWQQTAIGTICSTGRF